MVIFALLYLGYQPFPTWYKDGNYNWYCWTCGSTAWGMEWKGLYVYSEAHDSWYDQCQMPDDDLVSAIAYFHLALMLVQLSENLCCIALWGKCLFMILRNDWRQYSFCVIRNFELSRINMVLDIDIILVLAYGKYISTEYCVGRCKYSGCTEIPPRRFRSG